MIKFITGNKNKVLEIKDQLKPFEIEQLNIDLNEIQELDAKKIIEHKLREAYKHANGEFFVDDSSLYLKCFNYQLPGPLIKWFNDSIGLEGVFKMCKKMGVMDAKAVTYIGYINRSKKITYFEGVLEGEIVAPKGGYGFGYDPIFLPKGHKQTLSEMKSDGDFSYSPRGLAIIKFKNFLTKESKNEKR